MLLLTLGNLTQKKEEAKVEKPVAKSEPQDASPDLPF